MSINQEFDLEDVSIDVPVGVHQLGFLSVGC